MSFDEIDAQEEGGTQYPSDFQPVRFIMWWLRNIELWPPWRAAKEPGGDQQPGEGAQTRPGSLGSFPLEKGLFNAEVTGRGKAAIQGGSSCFKRGNPKRVPVRTIVLLSYLSLPLQVQSPRNKAELNSWLTTEKDPWALRSGSSVLKFSTSRAEALSLDNIDVSSWKWQRNANFWQ